MIIIFKDTKSKYAWLAKRNLPELLSGRKDNEITRRRNQTIFQILSEFKSEIVNSSGIDVGCGDGSLAVKLNKFVKSFTLTVLTEEEKQLLLASGVKSRILVCNSFQIPIKDDSYGLLICNSVLHSYGDSEKLVNDTLREFARILSPGGLAFIGELPYETSIKIREVTSVLDYVCKNLKFYGFYSTTLLCLKMLISLLRRKDYVINDITEFWISENAFMELTKASGFMVLKANSDSITKRNDYVLKKIE